MNRLAWLLQRRAPQIAQWGGAALIAGALLWHWLAVQPLEDRLQALGSAVSAPREARLGRLGEELDGEDAPGAQLAKFHAFFAQQGRLTDKLARVHEIARALGLEMKRADYRFNSQAERRLDRYQMIVPIRGRYTAIRGFVTTVLGEMPTLSLDQVVFQRKDIAEGAVDAQITFTFHLPK